MKTYKIISMIAFLFFNLGMINGQDQTLGDTSPDGKYQLFLNEKDIDNNSKYFESYVVDLNTGDKILLAKNYKNDAQNPNWFWDKNSKYLIFEGNEYGSVAKIQVWDLEDRFIMYEIKGSIAVDRNEAIDLWDSQNEVLTFYRFENIEAPEAFVLNLKTKKVSAIVESLEDMAMNKE